MSPPQILPFAHMAVQHEIVDCEILEKPFDSAYCRWSFGYTQFYALISQWFEIDEFCFIVGTDGVKYTIK